jgi:hypothetical protein
MPRWMKRGDRVAVLLSATALVAAAVLGYGCRELVPIGEFAGAVKLAPPEN